MKISTILDQIDLGALVLPEFQRGYVWNREQVRGLMDSLYRGHPVGSLLTWLTSTENATHRGEGPVQPGSVRLLLDGQQRITTLYGIIRGQAPPFFEGNTATFTGLHFNFATESFEFYAPIRMAQDPRWISVTDLMQKGIGDFIQTIYDNPDLASNRSDYTDRLNRVAYIKDLELHAEDVTGEDKTVDVVVDIFNRVNSAGTRLSKGDLALAKVCASWPDARTEMRGKLNHWKVAGFNFKLEWLLRCVNSILTGQALFPAMAHVSPSEFQRGLTRSEQRVDYLLNLVSSRLGLDHDRVLGSRYSFPLMVRYLEKRGGTISDPKERDELLFWYIHTLLWGRYSGSTETVLNQDLQTIEQIDGGLTRLIEGLSRNRGDLKVNPGDFSGSSIGARFYPLLYMLTRVHHAKDWDTGIELSNHMLGSKSRLHLHHIFPKSLLYKSGYQRQQVNALANFTFLTQDTNIRVSNRDPAEYIPEFISKHPGVIESHWIPMEPELWKLENYRDFLEARRELLAKAADDFLGGLLAGTVPDMVSSVMVMDSPVEDDTPIAIDEEEQTLLDANIWVIDQGLPEGEMSYELCDAITGDAIAILDLAWPDGLQEGYSQPVALMIDESKEVRESASKAGYRYYTDLDSFKDYVVGQILAVQQEAAD